MADEPQSHVASWAQDPLWYKDAIIYQLHVKAFYDSNNDGTGDFRGLTERLDYIQDLGVNTVWLLPFYPSPMRDDGYDVADYRSVHPDYGTVADARRFVREAHRRGLKVITELVINHTSDQHPWFQAARRAPRGSARRNFYIWSDTDKKFSETRIIFTDTEESNWAWDPVAEQYYWHRFFSHQPDLNHNNPAVVRAVIREMRFWLDAGVDGLRLDAIPYLCVREGTTNENLPETHQVLKQMRAVVDAHYQNRMFLAEANQWPEDVSDYFGDGDECHMAYHFPLMPRMYMALAQEDRYPIIEIMAQTPEIPPNCQWAIFLRNHDELTLEMVTDRERDYMYEIYAADKRMRVNIGIRRRLAPLLDNDPERIKLMNSLLLSMPGSPIIYYGDEIAMGDNIFLGDRNAVRTPMQWTPDRNAGFSRADPQRLYLPPVMDPIYGYQAVNVEAQSRDPSSLLNWMKRIIAIRKTNQAFGRGTLEFLRPGNRKVLAYLREYDGEIILCVVNLSRNAQPVELDLARFRGKLLLEMFGHTAFPPIGELPYLLTLPSYGVYWFRVTEEVEEPYWHEEYLPPLELPVLVLVAGWRSFFPDQVEPWRQRAADRLRTQLERDILPYFLPAQRWFGAKGDELEHVELERKAVFAAAGGEWLLALARVYPREMERQTYFLPLATVWGEETEQIRSIRHFTLAKVRQHARVGVLADAFADEAFCRALVYAMRENREMPFGNGRLRFIATDALNGMIGEGFDEVPIRRPGTEGSNSAVIFGDRLFLKAYRRLQVGINPEFEMGRFLTDVARFAHSIPSAGVAQFEEDSGATVSLALLQGYVENQGDAWTWTLEYLGRFLERVRSTPEDLPPEEVHPQYRVLMRTLGRRTGELHCALAQTTGDPAFDPEPLSAADLDSTLQRLREDLHETLGMLAARDDLQQPVQVLAARLLALRPQLDARLEALAPRDVRLEKIRHHGDYHLGQVLVVENDFMIIDFEGEPARPLAERRLKHAGLRDVAGMLRSFSYAAYAALFEASAERPDDFASLEPHARLWEALAREAFLKGYHEEAGDCPAYPAEPLQAQMLIDLFTLEKAVYELRYELANRPEWVGIPIRGILALVEAEAAR